VKPREHFYVDITMTPRNCPIKDRPMKCNARVVGVLSVSEEVKNQNICEKIFSHILISRDKVRQVKVFIDRSIMNMKNKLNSNCMHH
jgi:hypothetical protein